jgi:DNA polymerase-3 subunit epsilon
VGTTILTIYRGEDRLEDEIAFLKTKIYLSEVPPRLQTLTALSRFSVRV